MLASILKAYHKSVAMGWTYDINEAFADLLGSENTQFNRVKFLEACGTFDYERCYCEKEDLSNPHNKTDHKKGNEVAEVITEVNFND